MKYTYYNLINNLRTTLKVDSEESSVNPDDFNNIVERLNWYNLPQDIKRLIDMINHSSIIIDNKVNWFTVREKAEEIYNNFQ